MWLLVFLLITATFEDLCYGTKYRLPGTFTLPLYNRTITYTTKVGKTKIVVNNQQSLDPRFQVLQDGIEMADLTEQDNEAVLSTERPDFVKLSVKNCGSLVKKLYGSSIIWNISKEAEYLEFSKYTGSDFLQPTVLWNRTDPTNSRGNLSGNDYELNDLTQQDSGYYRFRSSKHQLLTWQQIVVKEHVQTYIYALGKIVYIEFPVVVIPSQVIFTPAGAETHIVLENGNRVTITDQYITIDDATYDDAGTYDIFDKEDNLILHVALEINEKEEPLHWYFILAITAFGAAFIGLCGAFCWKKYKSKRKHSNTAEAVTPAAIFQALKDYSANNPQTLQKA